MNTDKTLKKFYSTFGHVRVPEEWQQELENYLVHGYCPGSFHKALFSNDLMRASMTTHSSNTWAAIVIFMKWLHQFAPRESYGDHETVDSWLKMSNAERRNILEKADILATAWELLKMEERDNEYSR